MLSNNLGASFSTSGQNMSIGSIYEQSDAFQQLKRQRNEISTLLANK